MKKYDILSVGELLIDFISEDYIEDFSKATNFKQFQGGSPANMCLNMHLLGNNTKLVCSVGSDAMGKFLHQKIANYGMNCDDVAIVPNMPSTLILVTRSRTTPDFEAYRMADCQISMEQLAEAKNSRIFHTTCFALSKKPAQTNIMNAAKIAAENGVQLSIDANYAQKIWNDRTEAQQIVETYCSYGAIVKVSDVDWSRLYPNMPFEKEKVAEHFLSLGATEVCVTLGEEGSYVSNGNEAHSIGIVPIKVVDTTGAGDAFWSGYLTAWLDGKSLKERALAGRKMASIKLQHLGSLEAKIDKSVLYEF
ncbi:MAG: carbohydrate kinase family protein [Saprospiraceae bacterium]